MDNDNKSFLFYSIQNCDFLPIDKDYSIGTTDYINSSK